MAAVDYKPIKLDEKSKAVLNRALANASRRLCSDEFGIIITNKLGIHTISIVFLEELFKELGVEADSHGGVAQAKLKEIGTFVVSNRVSEDGEKGGNRVPSFIAGPDAKQSVKNDSSTEED
jgi:hypothetical protein